MQQALQSVSDVMRPGVVSVSESTALDAVGRVMREHHVHAVLMLGHDGAPRGWITARGMLRHPPAQWRRISAGEAISEPCVRVVPSATIAEAIAALLDGEVSHIAVMRPGSTTPEGVVSDIDLVGRLSR